MARRLAEAGYEVIALTRSSPVERPVSGAARHRFRVVKAAIEVGPLPTEIDAVVHTAATSIWTGISVERMIADNVAATRALVLHAIKIEAKAFVFFSSVSAFGSIQVPILTEAEPSVNLDAYGATKLLGEQLLADVAPVLPSLSIRLPAVIGRGSKRNWPSECLRKLKGGEPLTAFNPDAPFNNVLHEADLESLIVAALARGLQGAETGVFASSGSTTVGKFVTLLAERLGSASPITWTLCDKAAFLIDSCRLQRRFGVIPMTVEEALEAFVTDDMLRPANSG